ncbi:hypothetical protein EDC52_104166 [Biostraticola tofi]|uniref:Uncharacterized protein n=1 Tax=Biostraticola tofi TaxID=466109 RepID=A0A4R3YW58_9GAMM|nr:hypothetical protein EDC52_104166 [Biostraticola tofi]
MISAFYINHTLYLVAFLSISWILSDVKEKIDSRAAVFFKGYTVYIIVSYLLCLSNILLTENLSRKFLDEFYCMGLVLLMAIAFAFTLGIRHFIYQRDDRWARI